MVIPLPKNKIRSPYPLKYNDSLSEPHKKTSVYQKEYTIDTVEENDAKLLRHFTPQLTFTRANKEVSVGSYVRKREMNHWPCVSTTCQGYLSSHVSYLK